MRHDDQVDSVSQALAAIDCVESHRVTCVPLRVW